MSAAFTSSGGLRRLEVDGRSLLLYPAAELEAGPANIYLRLKGDAIEALGILSPESSAHVHWSVEGPLIRGRWRDLEYRAAFRLAAGAPAWFWHVEVINRRADAAEIDLIYAQDIALTPYQAVRTNEYYVSQYLDLTPVASNHGIAVAVRQNMPGSGAPWVLVGGLRDCVAWGTDALQLGRRQSGGDVGLGLLADRLPSRRLQHEHTLVLLQERPTRLRPGDRLVCGVFGLYKASHPAATSGDDAAEVAVAIRQPEAVPAEADQPEPGDAVIGSLFSSAANLACGDLTDDEIDRLVGRGRRHIERDQARPLAFFTNDGRQVVLQAKEATVLRPHGHILRTGDRLVPDELSLTSTVWMAGVFHSQVTQGHAALNRILSTRRGYLGWHRAAGLRIFVESSKSAQGWALLDAPSAWCVAQDRCTWWYRHATGLIEVIAEAPVAMHELTLRVRVLEGEARRLLVCANVAFDDDDGEAASSPLLSIDATGVTVRPPAGSSAAGRFANASFRFSWPATHVEHVGRDESLFLDGHSRGLPWITLRTAPTDDFALSLRANLVPGPDRTTQVVRQPAYTDFWSGVSRSIGLVAAPGSPMAAEVERMAAVLPWFAQNALVHYLSPRGLEQYTGGAWGTRDVCQGPVGLLIALDQMPPLRDVITRVFRAQLPRGDWPQWFEFFPTRDDATVPDAHGDVIFWPLLALGEYLRASGDGSLLNERLPFAGSEGPTGSEPVLEHVRRALARIAADTIPGTPLPAYGHGDWNDSLRPAHPELAARLCSTWTVTLQVEALRTMAKALRAAVRSHGSEHELALVAEQAERIAADSSTAMRKLLVHDGILAGYGLFRDDASVEPLVHPADRRTGLNYGLLHIVSAISADLVSADDAEAHLALVEAHLMGPDGARLFDRPAAYRGGPMEVFQRAEAATFFGREIGLMYMHAHLRYAEALARYGDSARLFRMLNLANPIGLSLRVPAARPRQSTCYFSSSDAVFADRYEAAAKYGRAVAGDVPLEGGWRVYSSGPGLFLRLIVECLLGLRRRAQVLEVDPVLDPGLDGLQARVPLADVPMDVTFRVGPRGVGPLSVTINGRQLQADPLANPYRQPGVAVDMARLRDELRPSANTLTVEVG